MRSVYLPLHVPFAVVNESEGMVSDEPRLITLVTRGAEPETTLSVLNAPHIPKHDNSWQKPGDANLVTMCGLVLSHQVKKLEKGGHLLEVRIDAAKFHRPEGLKMTKEEVLRLVKEAIQLNFPKARVTVDG